MIFLLKSYLELRISFFFTSSFFLLLIILLKSLLGEMISSCSRISVINSFILRAIPYYFFGINCFFITLTPSSPSRSETFSSGCKPPLAKNHLDSLNVQWLVLNLCQYTTNRLLKKSKVHSAPIRDSKRRLSLFLCLWANIQYDLYVESLANNHNPEAKKWRFKPEDTF